MLISLAVVGAMWFGINALRRSSYPLANNMPQTSTPPLGDVLREIETQIELKAPKTFAALRPGLGQAEIERIERTYGLRLTDEMRQLYEWHDGITIDAKRGLFGIHQFLPLEYVAQSRSAAEKQLSESTMLQRAIYWVLCGHRKNWIDLFPDGAGDGYYADPTRIASKGQIFYNFNEMGDYRFYPTLADLMNAISECYDAGLYTDTNTPPSTASIEREFAIHNKYSGRNSP